MEKSIKIEIYGNKDEVIDNSCQSKGMSTCSSGCSGQCSSEGGSCCHSGKKTAIGKAYDELIEFFNNSSFKDKVNFELIEISSGKIGGNEEISDLLERGFYPPITVVDGIIRYYGGISNSLILNDVEELLK